MLLFGVQLVTPPPFDVNALLIAEAPASDPGGIVSPPSTTESPLSGNTPPSVSSAYCRQYGSQGSGQAEGEAARPRMWSVGLTDFVVSTVPLQADHTLPSQVRYPIE